MIVLESLFPDRPGDKSTQSRGYDDHTSRSCVSCDGGMSSADRVCVIPVMGCGNVTRSNYEIRARD